MRLIDADAFSEEMKRRQDACEKWMHNAEMLNDEDMIARANGAWSVFIETKLTLDKQPTVSPDMAQVLAYECGKDSVQVVRCKDCRYFHENVFGDEIGMGKPYDCLIVGHCCCEFWGRKGDGSMTQTSPEGFCSWGERRNDE